MVEEFLRDLAAEMSHRIIYDSSYDLSKHVLDFDERKRNAEFVLEEIRKLFNDHPLLTDPGLEKELLSMVASSLRPFSVDELASLLLHMPPFHFIEPTKRVKAQERLRWKAVLFYSVLLFDWLELKYFEGLTYKTKGQKEWEVVTIVPEHVAELAELIAKDVMKNRVAEKWAHEHGYEDRDEREVEGLVAYVLSSLPRRMVVSVDGIKFRSVAYTVNVPERLFKFHRPVDVLSQLALLSSIDHVRIDGIECVMPIMSYNYSYFPAQPLSKMLSARYGEKLKWYRQVPNSSKSDVELDPIRIPNNNDDEGDGGDEDLGISIEF